MNYLAIIVISICLTQCWSAYLPLRFSEENQSDQNDTEKLQQQSLLHAAFKLKHLQNNNNNGVEAIVIKAATTTTTASELNHRSYDTIDDVVYPIVDNDVDIDAVLRTGAARRNEEEHQITKARFLQQLEKHSEKFNGNHNDADNNSVLTNIYDNDNDEQVLQMQPAATTANRKKRQLSDWLIAPNTRWCGRGNLANDTYNHLGGASSADKCCRKHDHCQLFIPAMNNRFELFNYRPYTLSHCNCDRRFRTCLKMANDEDATTIGKLFFNMVQSQCFVLRTEKVCQERSADGTCVRELVKQKAIVKNNKKF